MSDAQYTFDTQRNAYFLGSDLRVTETSTGHTVIVNEKEGMLGVNVKDETTVQDFPADVMEAWNRLPESRRQQIYEGVAAEYWRWAADLAETHGFSGVSQEGRGGGWLCVSGLGIDGGDLIDPGPGTEARDDRDRFLAFAFEAERAIEDHWRPQLYQAFKEEASKPVHSCPNCGFEGTDLLTPRHVDSGCIVAALVGVVRDRGEVEIDQAKIAEIDADGLWGKLGPITDETRRRGEGLMAFLAAPED